ncbi:MAG: hypothetical protein A2504_07630 [Bdellovibrionales bacterium RIFOXYD12_FULL_39_22]|nr:MAG: hypothetical protein A2385_10955 [Bdellovibrionales bacterium RIFOXYB1_FULL_39_21]OFZ41299.1 MAG: hypothetical protein A2485_00730 [Bdellovibrionales bacterium RIFOXYC12_FULL_39_17]OFZ45051.1 MAG: hypothetical protein A2404_11250 [Bdellovibrionales bacterium RIFOXYC1_FULL_39_130]OFZ70733.1 MAG: hypothetical protein A2451_05070 [Bdellovibrionales bacterium RIFOXYC2_FULL_39_8]OFZ74435.1 MAG: hypothetical protein A2560_11285 [Bdellovibrionales bacterium RIFOXYD1_FULL_39_84]OFZ92447.1 MAG:
MKLFNLVLVFLCAFHGVSIAQSEVVEKCDYISMSHFIVPSVKEFVITTMEGRWPTPITVVEEKLEVIDQGIQPFEDHEIFGTSYEHAFEVKFETDKGTPVEVFSTIDDPLCLGGDLVHTTILGSECFNRQKFNFIFVPEPREIKHYDDEGNYTHSTCNLWLTNGFNRFVVFMNSNTEVLLDSDLVNRIVLGVAKIKQD